VSAIALSYGSATGLTTSGLSSLGNGSTATSNAYDCTSTKPLDVIVEVVCTVGTVSGNKQYLVYVIDSVDGTNYSDTTVANMRLLGPAVSCPSNSTAYRSAAMSVAAAFGGVLPPYFKVVVSNDSGASFTAGSIQTREVAATVT
jgi:hypothetical protein